MLRVLTQGWGIGLVGEAVVRTWFAWQWPPERFLAVMPVFGYGAMGALAL